MGSNATTENLQNIPEFFAGRSVFITGGSGFVGKVLIEKLLRSCPDLEKIYVLLRPKKGKGIEQRIKDITDFPLFSKVKEERPSDLDKLQVISGDVVKLNLGMSPADRQLIQDTVSVVFHVAATIRFDEPLVKAVLTNVRGTQEVIRLASEIKQLKVLLHTSTAYSNTPYPTIEERLYEAPMDWRSMLTASETEDDFTMRIITPKIIGNRPNTYIFTKALAEHVINDYRNQLPVVIYRPSIVSHSVSEPLPGWIDNLYGPFGLMVGVGKGVTHVVYGDPNLKCDIVPVDSTTNGMIITSWLEAQTRTNEMPVYNSTFSGGECFHLGYINQLGQNTISHEVPFNNALYYPCFCTTKHFSVFYVLTLLLHILPALLVDGVRKLTGRKTVLLKLQRRIYNAFIALNYFTLNSWRIENSKFQHLSRFLSQEDYNAFNYEFSEFELVYSYPNKSTLGFRRYVFKMDDESLPEARHHISRLYVLHLICKILAYSSAIWVFYSYSLSQKLISTVFGIVRALLIV